MKEAVKFLLFCLAVFFVIFALPLMTEAYLKWASWLHCAFTGVCR